MRFGLDRMRRLMTALDAPHERFAAIHVVGTNGKSSTVRMIAALLHHHGVHTGAYLSPHLVSFAERIRVDGADISAAQFAAAVGRARRAAKLVDRTLDADDRVTQFEALTAAAYAQLADAGVEVAVVEAGLGGRWDATNVIDAGIAVLTNVGLEHTRWLGPTVADIAREKLAVVAPRRDARARGRPAPRRRRRGAASSPNARARRSCARPPRRPPGSSSAPAGPFSGATSPSPAPRPRPAWAAWTTPRCAPPPRRRSCPGASRCSRADGADAGAGGAGVEVVLDGAHNPGGIEALAASLPDFLAGRPLVAVLSVLDDKDAAAMLRTLLPLCAGVVFTANDNPRALSPATLASLAGQIGAPAVGPRRGRPASRGRARPPAAGELAAAARRGGGAPAGSCSPPARSTSSPTSCGRPGAGRGSTL